MGSTKDNLLSRHSSDDEDSCNGAVAVIEMLRDHFGAATDKKMSRSELLQQKEDAFLDMKTRSIRDLTEALTFGPDGEEGKCSEEAVKLSKQPYSSMTLQEIF